MLTKGSMMTQPVEICQPLSLDIPVLVRWASEQNCHCKRDGCYAGIWHGFTITWVDLATNTVECPSSQQQKPQYVTISWGDQQILGWQRDYIGPLPSGGGHQFILMEIIKYSGMDLPSLVLLPVPPSLDFLITLYTLYIIEISHTIFFFWSRNTFHSERGKTNGLTTMDNHP